MEPLQSFPVCITFSEFFPQFIQEQWFDKFQDICLSCVMCPKVSSNLVIHNALEQSAGSGVLDRNPHF